MLKWAPTLLLVSAQCLFAQGFARPGLLPPKSEWPAELTEHFGITGDVLVDSLQRRAASIKDFQFPLVNVGWSTKIMRLDESTFIFTYSPSEGLEFQVQGIECTKKEVFIDYTILGPTESAADFYEANVNFLISKSNGDLLNFVECSGDTNLLGGFTSRSTDIPGMEFDTSEDRVMRHLCAWLHYFQSDKGKNPQRAADFLVTLLDKKKARLLALESEKNYQDVVDSLDLFDKQFPVGGFDRSLPLDVDARARIRSYFETTIRLCGKLKPFMPDADTRISKDEALLATFR
jgi:hypothetical protein